MPPWGELLGTPGGPGALRVLGFEPGSDEGGSVVPEPRLGWSVCSLALWSEAGSIPLHIGNRPGTSSVHPPDPEVLDRFTRTSGEPRDTVETLSVPATTVDDVVKETTLRPSFLKLDTQGAEYDILSGARRTLQHHLSAVLAEVWTVPVHREQGLLSDADSLLTEHGFELANLSVGGRWRGRIADRMPELRSAGRITQLDTLYLRRVGSVLEVAQDPMAIAHAALVADLYAFTDDAITLLEHGIDRFGRVEVLDVSLRTMLSRRVGRMQPVAEPRRRFRFGRRGRRRTRTGGGRAAPPLR